MMTFSKMARPIRTLARQRASVAAWVALTHIGSALVPGLSGLVGLTLLSAPARAQTPVQTIDEGLRRQQDRARVLQQRIEPASDVLQATPRAVVASGLPVESPCFVIRNVHLLGPGAPRFEWLLEAAQPYVGSCAGVAGLSQIAAALDARLIELGYVTTRVTLPQQNLKDGQLTFRIHIGRVAAVEAVDESGAPDAAWGTWWNAFPVGAGDVLNVRDLEQGVEQMKRLPSTSVATELTPGAGPDTSVVRIVRQTGTWSDRLRGAVTLDNSGSAALGKAQLSSYLAFDNPLGLNDIVLLSASSNAERPAADHRSQSLSFNYSVPWGYNTFSFSDSHSRFAQIVQGTSVRFLSSGASDTSELKWHRTLVRTSAAKAGVYAAVSKRRTSSFLDDVELLVQRRRVTNAETGITYRRLVGDGSVEFELGYRRGISWQDAQMDFAGADAGGLTQRPSIKLLSATFIQPFQFGARPWQYVATVRGQHTPDATLSADQFAIGSRFNVRGFDEAGVLLAESGYFVRNEWATPVRLGDGMAALAYAGIDYGRVWGPSARLLVGDSLAGVAFGLRGRWQSLQFDVALAAPLHQPQGFRSKRWNPYLSLSYAF
jgi:hemolysin activation/secretion protein